MSSESTRLEMTTGADGALVLSGEIDSFTAPELATRLGEDGIAVIELSEVTFIDSSGLRALVEAHQRRLEAGSSLTLRSPSAAVQRLLEISGLHGHLDVVN